MRNTIIQSAVAILAIVMLVFGRPVSMPDNVHTLHGLPLNWGTHQLVTIAGPVDIWRIDMINLTVDLVIWFAMIILVPFVLKRIE